MGNGTVSLTRLQEAIGLYFDLEGVRGLAFSLDIKYDELRGEVLDAKIRALLEYVAQRDRISDLLYHLNQQRPSLEWDSYLPAEQEATSPYKGLQYFTEQDERLFFGRQRLTTQLLERLQKERFLVVVGASGSGKSSIVRAGVVPAIRRGEIGIAGASSKNWPIHIITPTDQPLKSLAVSLTRDVESLTAATTLAADLRQDSSSLDLFLIRQMAEQADQQILLIIDQFEELFTQCNDKTARQQFIDNLVTAVQSGKAGRLKLVLTLRADFYVFAVQYESLRPMLETGQQIIGEMSETELREAVLKPAEAEGWHFQSGLVETILRDVAGEPGSLPLLSHALQETWNRREGRMMTLAGYQDAGGVRAAIAKTADDVYAGLSAPQQALARRIFLRLTELGEGTEDTRRRVWQSDLVRHVEEYETVASLLQRLADARLVTTDTLREQDGGLQEVVEVSHEALIREWPTLRAWLNENRDWLRLHRRLSQDTKEWLAGGQDPSLLYRGGRLVQVREQLAAHENELIEEELAFIESAIQERDRLQAEQDARRRQELEAAQELAQARQFALEAQQRRTTAVRRAAVGLTLLLVIAVIATIAAVLAGRQATDAAQKAQNSEAAALQAAADALDAQGTAQAEATRADLNLAAAQAAQETAVAEARRADTNAATAVFNEQLAEKNAAEVIAQAQIARSQALAVSSQSIAAQEPMNGLLLAITAGQTAETALAMNALNQQLLQLAAPVFSVGYNGSIQSIWNEDETHLLTWGCNETSYFGGCDAGLAQVWDVTAPVRPLLTLQHDNRVSSAVWNRDESHILTTSQDGSTHVWDAASGDRLFTVSHDVWVDGAAWNNEESHILTWGCNEFDGISRCSSGAVMVWEADSGEPVSIISQQEWLKGAIWNSDGSLILSWGCETAEQSEPCAAGVAQIWDVNAPEAPLTIFRHQNWVNEARWNRDESRILTRGCEEADDGGNCNGGTIKVWDAAAPEAPLFVLTHDRWVLGATWSLDESRILSWGCEEINSFEDCSLGTAKIWDAASGDLLVTVAHEAWIDGAALNQAGSQLLTWGCEVSNQYGSCIDGTATVWDATSGSLLFPVTHQKWVTGAAWNKDESRILTWGCDEVSAVRICNSGAGRLWDAAVPGDPLVTLPYDDWVDGAIWNSDGSQILSWGCDGFYRVCNIGTVRLWDIASGGPIITVNQGAAFDRFLGGARWNKDENQILAWGCDETDNFDICLTGTVKVWDRAVPDKPILTLNHGWKVYGADWNQDESRILTWGCQIIPLTQPCSSGAVKVWDTASPESPLLTITYERVFLGAVFSRDESRIMTWSEDGTIHIWDAATGQLLVEFFHQVDVTGAVWNEDGSLILTASGDETAQIWDATSGVSLLTVYHPVFVNGAIWNKDESRLITWGDDHRVTVWDAESGYDLLTVSHHDAINGAAWNEDESRLITWSEDRTSIVWDGETGEPLLTFNHSDSVNGAAWNEEESRILTWSIDGTAKVWDSVTGENLFTLPGDGSSISTAAWSQDGHRILLATVSGLIRVYYSSIRELAEEACRYTTRNFTWEAWQLYFPDQSYQLTCERWPPHSGGPG